MPDSALSALTASTPGTAGLLYAVQGGADRKLSMTAAGAQMIEAANAADQAALLTGLLAKAGGTMTGALAIASGTLTDSAPALNITQTWNDITKNFVAHEIAVTNTASLSSGLSYLQRIKVGGSVLGGSALWYGALTTIQDKCFLGEVSHGLSRQSSSAWNMEVATTYLATMYATEMRLSSPVALTWKGDTAPYSGSADTKLSRASAGFLKITDGSDVLGGLQLGTASSSLQVGTHSAIGAETVTGFITIKDSAGNDRKIAVVS